MVDAVDCGYQRLEDQIIWYDTKSMWNQRYFKRLKLIELLCIAIIPVLAVSSINPLITAGFGIVAIMLESLQHLWQYQHNWITYRATSEALKHEKFLYLSKVQQYDLPDEDAKKRLAERVESLISTEHSKWVINSNRINSTKEQSK